MLPASVVLPGLALVLSLVLTPLARAVSRRLGVVDRPNDRKIHGTPMPTLGGLAFLAAFLLVLAASDAGFFRASAALPESLRKAWLWGLPPVLAIALVDDVRGVSARWKALIHLAAAVLAVRAGLVLGPEIHVLGETVRLGVLSIPLSIAWIVGVTSAFNLVDGLDGLSAGLALLSALGLSPLLFLAGAGGAGTAALVLAGALAGFLPYNVHPARVFLGDAGASGLGFLLAGLALAGTGLPTGLGALAPLVVLGLPVAETFLSIGRRLVLRAQGRGNGVFEADRDHVHHRLLRLGVRHARAVLLLWTVGLACALAGLASVRATPGQGAVLLVALLLAALASVRALGYLGAPGDLPAVEPGSDRSS